MKYIQGLDIQAGGYRKEIEWRLKEMNESEFSRRFWSGDKSLWSDQEESVDLSEFLMGWLNVIDKMLSALPVIESFTAQMKLEGYRHAILLGMGGSSLAPLVLSDAFMNASGLKLHVLDSTDAETIRDVERKTGSEKTLFIISSKSGSTVEVKSLYAYFFNKVKKMHTSAGNDFIAITDENTPLYTLAVNEKFKKIFINFKDIGGRYSALSYFGIVPAALKGVDVRSLLNRTKIMAEVCGPHMPVMENPGIVLGVALAEMAKNGCNKLSYFMPPSLQAFGSWVEQLVAESTGKSGKGILPLKGDINCITSDQVMFFMNFAGKKVADERVKNSLSAQVPHIQVEIKDELDLGKEFFRWEIATATAGALLKINPFDQPNVQESKTRTNEILKKIAGRICFPAPTVADQGLCIYSDVPCSNAKGALQRVLVSGAPGTFVVLQAYLPMRKEISAKLEEIRTILVNKTQRPVSIDFGPRYLHSTGQFYKGGSNTGIYLQLISMAEEDLPVPGQPYTFDVLKKAQALGDMQALSEQNRKVLLLDLDSNIGQGLESLRKILTEVEFASWHKDNNVSSAMQTSRAA